MIRGDSYAYLVHLLAWSLPILGLQLVVMLACFGRRSLELLRACLPPALWVTAWLVAADHLAIAAGIWRFGEGKHLGVYLGQVPLEEVAFFLVTNLLVSFGITLFRELHREGVRKEGRQPS